MRWFVYLATVVAVRCLMRCMRIAGLGNFSCHAAPQQEKTVSLLGAAVCSVDFALLRPLLPSVRLAFASGGNFQ